ncbi:hypothetical protein GCM10009676_41320 [Prauserella halophila]|uniref:Uncharacterized protein n=1 Tax=Prauserella halophila TaxID=185641 RepID=A0ABN1WH96_9PSEU
MRWSTKKAATDAATTGRSQLWNPYSTSGGPSAHSSARHPASLPSSHAVTRPNGASSTADQSRNSASVSAKTAPAQMSTPVSTGYSSVPPTSCPSAVMSPWTYGKTWLSTSLPSQRNWMSE